MRLVIAIGAGILLGGLIHLIVILTLPELATRDLWSRLSQMGAQEQIVVLDPVEAGEDNPLWLDPELVYGVCQLSLEDGPGLVNGEFPFGFWSVAIFNRQGHVIYSTTDRVGTGQSLEMGIFNAAQTRLLAEQRFEIEEGMLIVESPTNDIFVVIRLAPEHEVMRARYIERLQEIRCITVR